MTSKNKYIKTLDKFLDIMKSKSKPSFYENEKDQIAEDLITACKKADLYDELTQEPTLDECIKEWEEKGWRWHMDKICIKLFNKEDEEIDIHIWLSDKTYTKAYKEFYQYITIEEHNLIHKTLKALEEMK